MEDGSGRWRKEGQRRKMLATVWAGRDDNSRDQLQSAMLLTAEKKRLLTAEERGLLAGGCRG